MTTSKQLAGLFLVEEAMVAVANLRVHCFDCSWKGTETELVGDYEPDGYDDVAPISTCPLCGSVKIINTKIESNE